jgi:hypothetical protein
LTDVSNLTDRDILIRLDTKMEQAEATQKALMARQEELERTFRASIVEINAKVTLLEHQAARQEGMFSGAKVLWGFLISIPSAIIAYLVGGQGGN